MGGREPLERRRREAEEERFTYYKVVSPFSLMQGREAHLATFGPFARCNGLVHHATEFLEAEAGGQPAEPSVCLPLGVAPVVDA